MLSQPGPPVAFALVPAQNVNDLALEGLLDLQEAKNFGLAFPEDAEQLRRDGPGGTVAEPVAVRFKANAQDLELSEQFEGRHSSPSSSVTHDGA
jgi:hypothetical protein